MHNLSIHATLVNATHFDGGQAKKLLQILEREWASVSAGPVSRKALHDFCHVMSRDASRVCRYVMSRDASRVCRYVMSRDASRVCHAGPHSEGVPGLGPRLRHGHRAPDLPVERQRRQPARHPRGNSKGQGWIRGIRGSRGLGSGVWIQGGSDVDLRKQKGPRPQTPQGPCIYWISSQLNQQLESCTALLVLERQPFMDVFGLSLRR